ncbi:MAG: KH domain-containing protein [Bacilli bacterium]|nr:KH domain-containing protein [Bacilli bacterium]
MLTLSKYEGKNKEEIIENIEQETNKKINEFYTKEKEIEGKLFKSKKYIIEIIEKKEIINFIKNYINQLDEGFKINIKSEVNEKEDIIKVILISNNNPILIGKEGKNIEAIQILLRNSIKNQTGLDIKINVDASNYKKKKDEYFEKEIKKLIKEILETHIDIKLDPMNSYKRRIVHNLVSKYNNLKTESVGEEPERYTIIKYKED